MSEQNKSVVRRIFEEHWNDKNPHVVAELFHSNIAMHTPDGAFRGHDCANQLLSAYAAAFPDFRLQIENLLSDGDHVTVRWTFTGTHTGPFGEIGASGNRVSVPVIGIFQVASGQGRGTAHDLGQIWAITTDRHFGASSQSLANGSIPPVLRNWAVPAPRCNIDHGRDVFFKDSQAFEEVGR